VRIWWSVPTARWLFVVAALGVVASALPAAATDALFKGRVSYQDTSPCHFRSPSFGRNVNTTVTLLKPGVPKVAKLVNSFGEFSFRLPDVPDVSGYQVEAVCAAEGTSVGSLSRLIDVPTTAGPPLEIVMPNSRPIITKLAASVGTLEVVAAPPGTTVTVRATASDPDAGQALSYQWFANSGLVASVNGPSLTWTLPSGGGLHFIYVLVGDGNTGFRQQQLAISTDANSPVAATPDSPPLAQPSDNIPGNAHFLAYPSLAQRNGKDVIDDRRSACQYYRSINAVGECDSRGTPRRGRGLSATLTFAQWQRKWGFDSDPGTTAIYANQADLKLQRDMHGKIKEGGFRPMDATSAEGTSAGGTDAAFFVCNYPDPANDVTLENVTQKRNLVACVAMEYSVQRDLNNFGKPDAASWYHNDGLPFTQFLTFGPTGELLLSVNLDGRGEKFMPGACVACHGGKVYQGKFGLPSGRDPNFESVFLPFDLANFKNKSGQIGVFTPSEEAVFHQLNQLVLAASPTAALTELIEGWYAGSSTTQNRDFVPKGWEGQANLYNNVFKPACRACHVALVDDPENPLNPSLAQSSERFASYRNVIGDYACGTKWGSFRKYSMPNAKVTYDDLWAVGQPTVLESFLRTQGVMDDEGLPVECRPKQ